MITNQWRAQNAKEKCPVCVQKYPTSRDELKDFAELIHIMLLAKVSGYQFSTLSWFLFRNTDYTASKKHESTLLHTYVLNEFLTADRSCTTLNIFEKTL